MKPTKQAKPVKGWIVVHPDYNSGGSYTPVYHINRIARNVLRSWRHLLKGPKPELVRVEIRVIGGKK